MAATLALLTAGCGPEPIQPKGPPPRTVTANPVTTGDVPFYLDTLGRATAFESVDIVSQVSGQIVGLHFEQGAMVQEGDLMATIFQPPYEAAVEQAQGALQEAQAQLAIDELKMERSRPLVPEKLISEQDFQALVAQVESDRGAVQQAEGQLLAAEVNLGYTEIRSPVSGMAGIYQINLGNVVSAGLAETLTTVLQMDPIYVDFIVPESSFEQVRMYFDQHGGKLAVRANYLSDASKSRMGEAVILGNAVGSETGTVNLRAVFKNADGFLWPNQPLGIRVILTTLKGALLAPANCVGIGQNGRFVFVIDEAKGTVEQRTVEVGQRQDDGKIVIKSGVKPGEKLVGEGLDFLRSGMNVIVTDGNPQDAKLPMSMIQPVLDMLEKYHKATPEQIEQMKKSQRLPPEVIKKLAEHGALTEKEKSFLLEVETGSTTGEPAAKSGATSGK